MLMLPQISRTAANQIPPADDKAINYLKKEIYDQKHTLLNIDIVLNGTLDDPPYLVRLYHRSNRIGHFPVKLKSIFCENRVRVYGSFNARVGDILEWRDNGVKNLGLVSSEGELQNLNIYSCCFNFQNSLMEYLRTRRMEYIVPFAGDAA